MRVCLTGGTGPVGRVVAELLRSEGHAVVALARDVARAGRILGADAPPPGNSDGLGDPGRPAGAFAAGAMAAGAKRSATKAPAMEIVAGDLADEDAVRAAVEGCDAVVHAAVRCELGVPVARRPALYRTNVLGTERVLRVAAEAGVGRVVHTSNVVALGDTGGRVVDESHERATAFASYREETTHLAQGVANRAAAEGQDVVIALAGEVYGAPAADRRRAGSALLDHLIGRFLEGRTAFVPFAGTGVTAVHRDDVAAGIVACLHRGRAGEAYVLGGATTTVRGVLDVLAEVTGAGGPRVAVPATVVRAVGLLGDRGAAAFGLPGNVGEAVRALSGATYWARHDKAAAELGYAPRDLAAGLARTAGAHPAERDG